MLRVGNGLGKFRRSKLIREAHLMLSGLMEIPNHSSVPGDLSMNVFLALTHCRILGNLLTYGKGGHDGSKHSYHLMEV